MVLIFYILKKYTDELNIVAKSFHFNSLQVWKVNMEMSCLLSAFKISICDNYNYLHVQTSSDA